MEQGRATRELRGVGKEADGLARLPADAEDFGQAALRPRPFKQRLMKPF
jgi:hypothetical protein